MSTRVNDEDVEVVSYRTKRNEELYREISKNDLDNFEIKSNSTVLGKNEAEIDVEKIKKILDTKYNETPKRRSIRIEEEDNVEQEIEKEVTKEYDINVVLEKAKENKVDNYEEERLKQIKNTEYDILKSLDIDTEKEKEEKNTNTKSKKKKDNLEDLINTIAINEKNLRENNSDLDLLSDLKGDDDTEVLEGLKEEIVNKDVTKELEDMLKNPEDEEEDDNTTENIKLEDTNAMDDTFYTKSNSISKKDLDEDTDFAKEFNSGNTFIKIAIAIISIIFIVGICLLIKILFFS